ncbi:hypothetical protein KUTeg_018235 [Tegillarca granosa]|uniref:Uncharacterized protein n=1 Tax=Tegillarca granosa TaxID=220873 RepID=A0ABQ9EL55_TEGGR|nr:hypothetical protein KUTeg_018235 [Tegillarca granosa]
MEMGVLNHSIGSASPGRGNHSVGASSPGRGPKCRIKCNGSRILIGNREFISATEALQAYLDQYAGITINRQKYDRSVEDLLNPKSVLHMTADRSLQTGIRDTVKEMKLAETKDAITESYDRMKASNTLREQDIDISKTKAPSWVEALDVANPVDSFWTKRDLMEGRPPPSWIHDMDKSDVSKNTPVKSSPVRPRRPNTPDTDLILDGDRPWEKPAVTFKSPVFMEDPPSKIHSPKMTDESPTLTGRQQPGSLEALKNMLFKLQCEASGGSSQGQKEKIEQILSKGLNPFIKTKKPGTNQSANRWDQETAITRRKYNITVLNVLGIYNLVLVR